MENERHPNKSSARKNHYCQVTQMAANAASTVAVGHASGGQILSAGAGGGASSFHIFAPPPPPPPIHLWPSKRLHSGRRPRRLKDSYISLRIAIEEYIILTLIIMTWKDAILAKIPMLSVKIYHSK